LFLIYQYGLWPTRQQYCRLEAIPRGQRLLYNAALEERSQAWSKSHKSGSARRRAQARRVGAIHRKVRERRKDLLHQLSHRLTAKAGVLKIETLNVKGMARNRHLALCVADAGMSRLLTLTFCAHKADWRGRRIVAIDPWCPGSQTCCQCGQIHREMRTLSVRMMVCDCGSVMGRDRNAAVYSEEPRKRGDLAPPRVEIGDQELAPVPVVEARILADVA
jgi:Putative transposase DNA-binding domain/Probable transposase